MERETLIATLAGGHTPVIFEEAGDFTEGEGMRITLLPHHLLFEVRSESTTGHIIVEIGPLLDALMLMTQRVGN